ncbi:DUF87 domain-containing protein [Rubrobacter marinus]|uniref:DUF87 domain-containing protein n=1 Tax=Rubrobacter marinus TaxID=2653852 RepID=A0A6G8PZT6_9ACTN|nr:DUF87 domain-containing protein [Rubrobacter marinus]QIN79617.1 DUF87 domain-containing protein [Rubrobacter marinus]
MVAGGDPVSPVLRFGREGAEGELAVDVDRLVSSRLLIQAESGGGKSWMIRYLLEETHGRLPHVLFDVEGEFASLRERYPYVLVSATEGEGDLPARPGTAKALCRRLSELGASAILDLFDLDEDDQQRFVRLFLEELLSLPRSMWGPRLVVVDEAERLAPERSASGASAAINSLVKRGRKRGLGAVLAVQRLSDLDKGAAGGLQNKLIGLTTLDTDVRRAGDALGFDRSGRAALQELPPGHFFAFGPAIPAKGVVLVRSGDVSTTHGEGRTVRRSRRPRPEALAEVLQKLAASLPEEEPDDAGAERPASTDAEVERLRRELASAEAAAGYAGDRSRWFEEENGRLRAAMEEARGYADELVARLGVPEKPAGAPERAEPAEDAAPPAPEPESRAEGALPPARRRILKALKDLEDLGVRSLPRNNLAVFAGQGPRSSAFRDHLAALNAAGLITYPSGGVVALTASGRAEAPRDGRAAPRTVGDLHRAWYAHLQDASARIVAALVERHPNSLSREELAHAAGQSDRSSAFRDRLAELRALGLVEYPRPGRAKASVLLFPEGLR